MTHTPEIRCARPHTRILQFISIILLMLLTAVSASGEGRLYRQVPSSEQTATGSLTVYDITRTPDGYTWLGTDRGLVRYDGEFVMSVSDAEGRPGRSPIKAVAPVGRGNLLAGTPNGVYLLRSNGGSYSAEPLLGGRKFSSTSALALDSCRAVIGGDEGMLIYNEQRDSVRHIRISHDALDLSNHIIDMAAANGHVFVLTKEGVFDVVLNDKGETIRNLDKDGALPSESPTSIAAAGGKVFVAGTTEGIFRITLPDGKVTPILPELRGRVMTSLAVSPDGTTLYIGTDGSGVVRMSVADEVVTGEIRHSSLDPHGPRSNQVYSLFTDRRGEVWMGYYQGGADYTPSKEGPFTLIDNPHTFNTRGVAVRALCLTEGYIVIGTREGVVIFDTSLRTARHIRAPHLRSEMVISLLNHNGKVLLGTYGGGLHTLDPSTGTIGTPASLRGEDVFINGNVFSIASDGNGNIWAGTDKGLYRISGDGKTERFTSYNSALPEGNVYGIFFDSKGKGWICAEKGLALYDPRQQRLRTDLFPISFPKDVRFRTVYEDRGGRLYFVPESGHVFTCMPDFSDERILDRSLLADTEAKGVVEDRDGNIWVSTNRGLFRLDKDGSVLRFGTSAGLPSAGFLQGQPQVDANGDIWFGNSEGLVKLAREEIKDYLTPPAVPVPTLVKGDGRLLESLPFREEGSREYTLTLPQYYNTVKLCFSTFTYAIEDPVDFEYSIDGNDWVRFSGELCTSLYALSPGSHRLLVRSAKDTEGESGVTTVVIKVPYPWHWRVIFILVAIVAVLTGIFIYRYLRHRRQASAPVAAEVNQVPQAGESVAEEKRKYVSNNLSRTEAREISHKVDEVMAREKPYLNSELKLVNLAEMVGVSGHKLSQFFSQHKGKTFYDYINGYRIEEFKRIVREEGGRNYTLTAMAEKAGFSSRASFFRYFKNVEGISPGEYLKREGKE